MFLNIKKAVMITPAHQFPQQFCIKPLSPKSCRKTYKWNIPVVQLSYSFLTTAQVDVLLLPPNSDQHIPQVYRQVQVDWAF